MNIDKGNTKSNKSPKYAEKDLVIVEKDKFDALASNPIDGLSKDAYQSIETLASWFVLRAPLTGITKLANPGLIDMFKSSETPDRGSRTQNRAEFECTFLNKLGLDCTNFEFIYRRLAVKGMLREYNLASNGEDVFDSLSERCVCFVGKGGTDSQKEDSCIESICHHMRNAFAHGRIAVKSVKGELFLFAEDGGTPRNVDYGEDKPKGQLLEIRFRILIKIATLEAWMDMLNQDGAA